MSRNICLACYMYLKIFWCALGIKSWTRAFKKPFLLTINKKIKMLKSNYNNNDFSKWYPTNFPLFRAWFVPFFSCLMCNLLCTYLFITAWIGRLGISCCFVVDVYAYIGARNIVQAAVAFSIHRAAWARPQVFHLKQVNANDGDCWRKIQLISWTHSHPGLG